MTLFFHDVSLRVTWLVRVWSTSFSLHLHTGMGGSRLTDDRSFVNNDDDIYFLQILVTSTLARSNTLWLNTSASRSSSDDIVRGARVMAAKVPAPRRLESVPGLMQRTESTTCRGVDVSWQVLKCACQSLVKSYLCEWRESRWQDEHVRTDGEPLCQFEI